MGSLESGRCILRATSVASSGCRSGSTATSRTGSPPLRLRAPPVPRPREEPVLRARPTRSTSSRCATGAPVGRITAQVDDNFQRFQEQPLGLVRLLRVRGRPRGRRGAARRAPSVAARPGLRPHGRPVGLHDERRVRRADRGPRAHADDPHALDAPLLPGAARGRRHGQGDGPADVGAQISGRDKVNPVDLEARRPGRAAHGIVVRPFRKKDIDAEVDRFMEVYNSAWEKNWGFVPLTEQRGAPLREAAQAVPRRALGLRGREGRRDRRRRADPARLQPGAAHMNGRILPFGWAKFLWYRRKIDRVRVFALGVKPRVAAHRRRRALLPVHFDRPRHAADVGRDGLDPRDQQHHEPRDGGDGRQGRAPLPALRARVRRVAPPTGAAMG